MLVNKSDNIFWKMIKNQKKGKETSNFGSRALKSSIKGKQGNILSSQFDDNIDKTNSYEIIEKFPTYTKISILQSLLKEMTSIKERFEDNKNNMLDKIRKNSKEYYKCKIDMKEIYDYCESNDPEKHFNYILVNNTKEELKQNYDTIYKVLLILRNNNNIMMNIINSCPDNYYEQFSDFLVNFLYEDTIDCTFKEEELLTILYLIIEANVINKLTSESYINIENNKEQNISYFIFKSLTRKPDVRNFTCSVLSEAILKLESYNDIISIDTQTIEQNIIRVQSLKQSSTFSVKKKEIEDIIPPGPKIKDEGRGAFSIDFTDYTNN